MVCTCLLYKTIYVRYYYFYHFYKVSLVLFEKKEEEIIMCKRAGHVDK